MIHSAHKSSNGKGAAASSKGRPARKPFIFGAKASAGKEAQARTTQKSPVEGDAAQGAKPAGKALNGNWLSEALKGLIHTAREQGHLTYDDINEYEIVCRKPVLQHH